MKRVLTKLSIARMADGGRKGGKKSKRKLTPEQAREMVLKRWRKPC